MYGGWQPVPVQQGIDMDLSLFDLGHLNQPSTSAEFSYVCQPPTIDYETLQELEDETDNETLFGSLRANIIGILHYPGIVHDREMVSLVREPQNPHDHNAVKVNNVDGVQVGYIQRELAKALSQVLDKNLARVTGTVPFGSTDVLRIPVDLTFWGDKENKADTLGIMLSSGFILHPPYEQPGEQSGFNSVLTSGTVFFSPSEVKGELDKLFESLEEGDKTSMAEPAQAVATPMYPHQKQALHWMMERENENSLPPFWESRGGQYYNSITTATTNKRPESVHGGILADDMGLGKTLEMIALILTNFEDGKPLAVPVQDTARPSIKNFLKREKSVKTEKRCSETPAMPAFVSHKTTAAVKKKLLMMDCSSNDTDMTDIPPLLKLNLDIDMEATVDILAELVESSTAKSSETQLKKMAVCRAEIHVVNKKREDEAEPEVLLTEDDPEYRPEVQKSTPFVTAVLPSPHRSFICNGRGNENSAVTPVSTKEILSSEDSANAVSPTASTDWLLNDVWEENLEQGNETTDTVYQKNVLYRTDDHIKHVKAKHMKQGETTHCLDIATKYSAAPVNCAVEKSSAENVSMSVEKKFPEHTSARLKKKLVPSKSEPDLPELSAEKKPKLVIDLTDDLPDLPSVEDISENEEDVIYLGKVSAQTKSNRPRGTLIICPLSVMSNWMDQLEHHIHKTVTLKVYKYHGTGRIRDPCFLKKQDIVLTTYATVAIDSKGSHPLQAVKWLRLVLDEGHAIRNPDTLQTMAIMELNAERKWVLTGTPIQNSIKDLWSIVNFLNISPFNDITCWYTTIEGPLSEGEERALLRVRHLLGMIALRRTKTQEVNGKPLIQLPEKNVFVERIKFGDNERKVYDGLQKRYRGVIRRLIHEGTLLEYYGVVLTLLLRLRQFCCHPQLVPETAETAPMDLPDAAEKERLVKRLLEVLKSGSDEECPICLDSLRNAVITPCAHVYCRECIELVIRSKQREPCCPLCAEKLSEEQLIEVPQEPEASEPATFSDADFQSSAKVDALMNALITLRQLDPWAKSLVVSQFTSFLRLIEVPLRKQGFVFTKLNGTMTSDQRVLAIEEFSSAVPDSPTIMLLSLKAGGEGINLTAANHVFLMDPAWNPASEEQCFDRCHRLGQTKDVAVTKFIIENSVEEKVLELQEKKRRLMQGAFGKKQNAEQRREQKIRDIRYLINV